MKALIIVACLLGLRAQAQTFKCHNQDNVNVVYAGSVTMTAPGFSGTGFFSRGYERGHFLEATRAGMGSARLEMSATEDGEIVAVFTAAEFFYDRPEFSASYYRHGEGRVKLVCQKLSEPDVPTEGFRCEDDRQAVYVGSVTIAKDGFQGTGSFSEVGEYSLNDMYAIVGAWMMGRLGMYKELEDGSRIYFSADHFYDANTKSEFNASITNYGTGPVRGAQLRCKLFKERP